MPLNASHVERIRRLLLLRISTFRRALSEKQTRIENTPDTKHQNKNFYVSTVQNANCKFINTDRYANTPTIHVTIGVSDYSFALYPQHAIEKHLRKWHTKCTRIKIIKQSYKIKN